MTRRIENLFGKAPMISCRHYKQAQETHWKNMVRKWNLMQTENGTVINYDHNGPASRYYEITGGYIQRCYENKIPIGIVFKEGENQNKILGLGLITKVSKNKLEL